MLGLLKPRQYLGKLVLPDPCIGLVIHPNDRPQAAAAHAANGLQRESPVQRRAARPNAKKSLEPVQDGLPAAHVAGGAKTHTDLGAAGRRL